MRMAIVVIIAVVIVFFGDVGQAAIGGVYSPDSGALVLVGSTVVAVTMWARRKIRG